MVVGRMGGRRLVVWTRETRGWWPLLTVEPMSPKARGLVQHGGPLQLTLCFVMLWGHMASNSGVRVLERQCSDTNIYGAAYELNLGPAWLSSLIGYGIKTPVFLLGALLRSSFPKLTDVNIRSAGKIWPTSTPSLWPVWSKKMVWKKAYGTGYLLQLE